jgi:hypothetical protein
MTDKPRIIEYAFPLEQTSLDSMTSLLSMEEAIRRGRMRYECFRVNADIAKPPELQRHDEASSWKESGHDSH